MVPPPPPPRVGGKPTGDPFTKLKNTLVFVGDFDIHGVEPKILQHAASQMFWGCDCSLRAALLAIFIAKQQINISYITQVNRVCNRLK